ncbi:Crp/Fnr family transcriptional regulator [Chryseobacterium wangxinyae]|uniref:Crp/Fnr family transcriptional regulator n=1 Tax=Chryseobacterium sp. CY350 TaxID=2997336 RepID=UPI00226E5914|nr:Crp/Fnr family transcriptional regulator [Chryseobacterium sp. CY350]MCY0976940.1 Crp/Fnr family transcriptional regulator [Chryseobacterium sp. CY350]WBZ96940.1 Crp/Fnr family transcriptional regulator [Chryseobacterium sp. CY350]
MIINEKLLTAYDAELITLTKDKHLFSVDGIPDHYFQVKSGCMKLTSDKKGNNQFIHGFAYAGDPVGETFLFSESHYSINAVALNQCNIYVLSKTKFKELIKDYSGLMYRLLHYISENDVYRMTLINKIAYGEPRTKIVTVIDHFKKMNNHSISKRFEVPFTRQQLASLTGLRVETVIRTIKIMECENLVEIINGKVFI